MSWSSLMEKLRTPAPTPSGESTLINSLDIVRLLRSAGGALLAQLALHGKLASVEWEEEKNRLQQMFIITLFGFVCVLCILFFTGAVVLAFSWETPYRIHAIVSLIAIYGIGVFIAWRRFQTLAALSGNAFAATREELAADIALIRSKL